MDLLQPFNSSTKQRIISNLNTIQVQPSGSTEPAVFSIPKYTSKLVQSHHFNQQLDLVLPPGVDSTYISTGLRDELLATYVYHTTCDLAALLTDAFISQYIVSGSSQTPYQHPITTSFLLTSIPPKGASLASSTSLCIINNTLYLSMTKDLFQQLGIPGKVDTFYGMKRVACPVTLSNAPRLREMLAAARIGMVSIIFSYAVNNYSQPIELDLFPEARRLPFSIVDRDGHSITPPSRVSIGPHTTLTPCEISEHTFGLLDVPMFFNELFMVCKDSGDENTPDIPKSCRGASQRTGMGDSDDDDDDDDETIDARNTLKQNHPKKSKSTKNHHVLVRSRSSSSSSSTIVSNSSSMTDNDSNTMINTASFDSLLGQFYTYTGLLTSSQHTPSPQSSLQPFLYPHLPMSKNPSPKSNSEGLQALTIRGFIPPWTLYNIFTRNLLPHLHSAMGSTPHPSSRWTLTSVIGIPSVVNYAHYFHADSLGAGGHGESSYTMLLSSHPPQHEGCLPTIQCLTLHCVDGNSQIT